MTPTVRRPDFLMGLFRDMLHSTKSTDVSQNIVFSLLTNVFAGRIWRPFCVRRP